MQNDLEIPRRFTVLRKTVLDPVWRAFNWGRGFWEDALINITGFVPFGCFFCAYFSRRSVRSPMLYAIVVGIAASTAIELGQVFLPTRDSSMDDLINNSLGTVLGAALYRGKLASAIDRGMRRLVGLTVSLVAR
jgi:glycopeptide antibiotics resistance protein